MRVYYLTRSRLSFRRAHTNNILHTAEAIQKSKDNTISVISTQKDSKSRDEILDSKGITVDIPLLYTNNFLSFLFHERNNFDAIYFRDPLLVPVALLVRLFLRKKIIFEIHGTSEWFLSRLFFILGVSVSHAVIFISEGFRSYYKPRKIFHAVIPCSGFYPELFNSTQNRDSLSLPANKKIILFTGTLQWSNLRPVIQALNHLSRDMVLVGVGLRKSDIDELYLYGKALGVRERLYFFERVNPVLVPAYLNNADILINPFVRDLPGSIAAKLYEYLASGVPIISTKCGSNQEIVEDEKNALLISKLTPKHVAEAVERIIRDPIFANKIANQAKIDSVHYSWEKREKMIIRFFDDCVNKL